MNVTGAGANNTITLGNGNDNITVTATSGSATDNTIQAGNGNNVVTLSGQHDTVTVGNGNNTINLNTNGSGDTHDVVNLGLGTNMVFCNSNGATINTGGGHDTVSGGSDNTFALNPSGEALSIWGFTPGGGDKIDLTQVLKGVSLAHDLSNLGQYITVGYGTATNTGLTIHGAFGVDTVHLLGSGNLTLGQIESSFVLPTH